MGDKFLLSKGGLGIRPCGSEGLVTWGYFG